MRRACCQLVLRFKKSLFAGVLDGGETEISLGKNRLARFMEGVESVTSAITPAAPQPEPEQEPEPGVESGQPLAQLIAGGVAFLQQLAASLPATPRVDVKRRRIEARRNDDGSMYLAVPMPSREAIGQFTEGLAALLRSMQG